MAAGRLSSQDRKDLERFTKFLIYKSLQIIVQSRLGNKIRTQSKSISSGADWFNIAIKDIPDVQSEAKRLLGGRSLAVGQTICVEISLKTADGDTMLLEVWYLTMNEQMDSTLRTPHAAYYRMGVALKSIFSVSRVTPAYKLSRQQTADNYVVCYELYVGEPKYYRLGDGYKSVSVAAVPMVTGTVNARVAYRTKLQISPQRTNCNKSFEVKPDHFLNGNSTPQKKARPCNREYNRDTVVVDNSEYQFPPAPCDSDQNHVNHNYMNGEASAPNGRISEQPFISSKPIAITKHPTYEARPDDFMPNCTPDQSPSPKFHHKTSAFAKQHTLTDHSMDLDDVPFESLLKSKATMNGDLTDTVKIRRETRDSKDTAPSKSSPDITARSSTIKNSPSRVAEVANDCEDFVMLELKTPFAGTDSGSELNQFYRECQTAPTLLMFTAEPDIDVELNAITEQLHMFETSMKDFDNFVSTLQDSD